MPGNPALTAFGKNQAEQTATYFLDKKVELIITSPLKRTLQTAQIIAKKLKIPLEVNRDLWERANWEKNLTLEKFHEIWQKASEDRDFNPSVGDSSKHAGNRIKELVEKLAKERKHHTVLLVTHGGIITDFLRNLFSDEYLVKTYFGDHQHLMQSTIKECSITAIKYQQGRFELELLASAEHLENI